MTKSQIDKLGVRLKSGTYSEEDVRLLDEYRQSFAVAYDRVIQTVFEQVGIEPTGRRIKSTQSIISKLQRQSTKLSQIQDIAGCRVTVGDIRQQDDVVRKISSALLRSAIVDRREKPSHGYRAVHIIARKEKCVEIQVRTTLQHLWAQMSEKLSDVIDPKIKYGVGPTNSKEMLLNYAIIISHAEAIEHRLYQESSNSPNVDSAREELQRLKERITMKLEHEIRVLMEMR